MERREAPGRWCYAALWRVWCDPPRAYGHSRLPGVTACEARAPNNVGRCASRRSTITDAGFLPASALGGNEATSGLASSAPLADPPRHERGRELSKAEYDYYPIGIKSRGDVSWLFRQLCQPAAIISGWWRTRRKDWADGRGRAQSAGRDRDRRRLQNQASRRPVLFGRGAVPASCRS